MHYPNELYGVSAGKSVAVAVSSGSLRLAVPERLNDRSPARQNLSGRRRNLSRRKLGEGGAYVLVAGMRRSQCSFCEITTTGRPPALRASKK